MSKLTKEEIFLIFDTMDRHEGVPEVREAIRKRLYLIKPPDRKTVTGPFKVGVEFLKRGPNAVLTTEEADKIAEKVGYGVTSSRVFWLYQLYQIWETHRHLPLRTLDVADEGGEEQYEDSPVAQFLPLVRVVAREGMKGGVYGGELKGKQNDIGMTKQQLEVLLASGPLNPDGVEDFHLAGDTSMSRLLDNLLRPENSLS